MISYAHPCRKCRRVSTKSGLPARSPAQPINVVRAKTVDLLVPAEAEIVIEGFIDTEFLEPEAPFGESHGYVNLQEYNAFMGRHRDHAAAQPDPDRLSSAR